LGHFPSVLVTGPRQSGKTTFLHHELAEETPYVSFDDPLERDFARQDPNGFLDRFSEGRVILDEIQYVPELFEYLKIRIDRERHRNGRFVLTGSQRFQLMANVSESLAGRIAILELYPFALPELPQEPPLASLLWNGTYPEPALQPQKRDLWVSSYLQTYVERDVRQLHNIQDLRSFETFVSLCAARHAQTLNMASLARDAGVSQPTVKTWLGVLEASYLIYLLQPYFENFGKRLVRSPKLYLLDPALVTALTRQPGAEAALAGAMGGALFEGLVVAEAAKTFAHLGMRPDLYFWRSRDGLEVDLVLRLGGRLVPVEIKRTATPSARHAAPLSGFLEMAGGAAGEGGVLVCRIPEPRPLPGSHLALPWQRFSAWLREKLG
jgi:predicted AAA+ superfamily ATPase